MPLPRHGTHGASRLLAGAHGARGPGFALTGPQKHMMAERLPPPTLPGGQFGLTRPAEKLDAAHWPVRGDLAHIALAGRCFVPHYAEPMPHVVCAGGALLRKAGADEAEALAELAQGTRFGVLDIAGGWCWGQVEGGGPMRGLVGYLPQGALVLA